MGSRSRTWLGALAALLAAAAQAGCGASGTSSSDPASLVPASAPLYVGVALEPSGGPHGPAVSDVRRLTNQAHPFDRLAETLLAADGSHPSFEREVRSWVGERAGVFLLRIPAGEPKAGPKAGLGSLAAGAFASGREQGAIVLDVSDRSGARRFLDARARQAGAHGERYRGVRLEVSPHGGATAFVGGFAVLGSEAGVKSAIDSSRGAPKLSGAPSYLAPSSDAVANAYLAPPRLGSGALDSVLGDARAAALLVKAQPSSLSLEGTLYGQADTTSLFAEAGARQLQALPGGSWLALGLADTATTLPRALALLGGVAEGGAGGVAGTLDALGAGGVRRMLAGLASSAKLRRSLERWAGPGGLFVSGSGLLELQAALTIDSKDTAASRSAVAELAGAAQKAGAKVASVSIPGTDAAASVKVAGFPAEIYLADGQGKFVVALGRASALGALHPSSTLAASPTYTAAATALGGGVKPSLILEFPALLSLLEAIGVAQSEALAGVLPRLKSLGRLTAGSSTEQGGTAGSTTRIRAVLELAGAASGG